MRLLYITTRISGAGGMQRVLSVKTDYLVKKGYDITIAVTNTDDDEILYDFNSQIKIVAVFPNKNRLFYFSSYKKHIRKLTNNISPDIVIVCDNGLKGFLIPMILKKYPLVYERHGSRFIEEKEVSKSIINIFKKIGINYVAGYMASKFNAFVVLTDTAKMEWKLSNIFVIPNPIWFQGKNISSLNNNIAIAVGRHTYEKGYDRMFEIWSKIIQKHPDWILNIYGKENPDCDLKSLAKKFNIIKNVSFKKTMNNIVEAYAESSVCLLTSRSEGFGMVLVEAMACGVPCVAYDCPVGPSDIITDGFNGFLIKDGDANTFVDRLNHIIEDKKHRVKLGTQAKDSIKKFDLDLVMSRWENLFETLRTK